METIREDGIYLSSLERGCLLECQVSWSCQVIIKNVIVKFQLAVHLEEFSLSILEQAFLKLLHVDISKLLVHFGVVDIYTV